MSAEYTNNHYVPQWYQQQFIAPDQADNELYLLDLKPQGASSYRYAEVLRDRRSLHDPLRRSRVA
jgi:hypothetical protein